MKALARLALVLAFGLAAAAPAGAAKPTASVNPMDSSVWEIGPITPNGNRSVNMPLTPSPHAQGWYFDFPQPDSTAGHVHYLTFKHGSLSGKSRIVLRYRIEADPGVQIYPTRYPGMQSMLTMYFQRRGDDWSGRGKYETYRWWATFRFHAPLTAGEHEMSVGLDENWTAVQTSSAASNHKAFRDAIREPDRVGFTFGGGDGFGHGVYATGPARFVVTSFQVIGDTNFGVRDAPSPGGQ
jgi:hypothetical protein